MKFRAALENLALKWRQISAKLPNDPFVAIPFVLLAFVVVIYRFRKESGSSKTALNSDPGINLVAKAQRSDLVEIGHTRRVVRDVEGVTVGFLDVATGKELTNETSSFARYAFTLPIEDSATVAELIAQRFCVFQSAGLRIIIRNSDNHAMFGGKKIGEIRRSFLKK